MTEYELSDLLKKHRWTLGRGKTGKQQVFSAKMHRGGMQATRYIGTANKIKDMTTAHVLAILARPAKAPGQLPSTQN